MSMISATFLLDAWGQDQVEEVEIWVPRYKEPTSQDYDEGYVPKRRCGEGSVMMWTRYDDEALTIEPDPSSLIRELCAAVGYLNKGAPISYSAFLGPEPDYLLYLEKKEVEEYSSHYEKFCEELDEFWSDGDEFFNESETCVDYDGVVLNSVFGPRAADRLKRNSHEHRKKGLSDTALYWGQARNTSIPNSNDDKWRTVRNSLERPNDKWRNVWNA